MKTKISTDFHIKPYNCSSLLSIKNSIILRHGNNIMISVISHQEIVIQAPSVPSYLDEDLPCWLFLLLMLCDRFLNYFLLFLHPLMIWENIKFYDLVCEITKKWGFLVETNCLKFPWNKFALEQMVVVFLTSRADIPPIQTFFSYWETNTVNSIFGTR